MKNSTQEPNISNVLNIAENPQFKAKVSIPLTPAAKGEFHSFSLRAYIRLKSSDFFASNSVSEIMPFCLSCASC